jgi:formate dehydrogenase subunit gamma
MLALVLILFQWIRHNFPNRHDLIWLLKGGGIIGNAHPPARKFNAGQKILFWLVIIAGASVSLSGWVLLFPFTTHYFADTFAALNGWFGTSLPAVLTPIQEQQYAELWHTVVAVFMIVVVFGHIYIGTIGMQGAIGAMTSGDVDVNWAREHHSVWATEELEEGGAHAVARGAMQPAE